MVAPIFLVIIFFVGMAIGLAFRKDTHPSANCRWCRNAHDKQGHEDLLDPEDLL